MRLVKVEKPNIHVKTLPANIIARILLDLRLLCSGYQQLGLRPSSDIALHIYEKLKKADKTYLFNVTNFDPELLTQCRDILQRRSMKPAYITYNHLERLEAEQSIFLKKYLPIYPENPTLHLRQYLELLAKRLIEEKRGDTNASFKWE